MQVLARCISGRRGDLLALGQEGGHNHSARNAELFAAEVGFGHAGLHGDGVHVAEGDSL